MPDSLVNPELLGYCQKRRIRYYNSAYMTLEEVLAVIEDAEKEGLNDGASAHRRTQHLRRCAGADGSDWMIRGLPMSPVRESVPALERRQV